MSRWLQRVKRGWREFVGPEATSTNTSVALVSGAVGAVGASLVATRRGAALLTSTALGLSALDLVGGAYVNNTRACARWYERAGQGTAAHLKFAALHVHPILVARLDHRMGKRQSAVSWACAHYTYMMLATIGLRAFPAYRRSLGIGLTAGGLLLDRMLRPSTVAPWFAWAYYPKLIMGHAAASLWTDADLTEVSSYSGRCQR